jgi:hypothetical protein
MVVALTALVIACAGTATAATVLIHSSSQIANGVITGSNIHANTITGKQIASGAVGAAQLANGSVGTSKLSAGALKTLGSGGGKTSTAVGSALEWDRQNGPQNVAANQPSQRVITANSIPPGVYAIFADANLSDTNPPGSLFDFVPTADAQCSISADADVAYGSSVIGGSFFAGSGNVTMQITHTFSGTGTITMDCASPAAWNASGSSIIVIRLSSAPKMAVSS